VNRSAQCAAAAQAHSSVAIHPPWRAARRRRKIHGRRFNLALAWQCRARVGILDADIYGPSQPLMLA